MQGLSGIAWAGLAAEDVDLLGEFYATTVGLPLQQRAAGACLFNVGNGAVFEIWGGGVASATKKGPDRQSLIIGFQVERIEPWIEDLATRGLHAEGPIESGLGKRWVQYTDPEGNGFEFKDAHG